MSEQPKCYTIRTPKAAKDHKCCECRGTISKGEKYHSFSGIWDTASTYKTCSECEQLRSEVVKAIRQREDYPAFGELYEYVFSPQAGEYGRIKRFMDIRRKRNAPESPNGWMERRERELENDQASNPHH